MQSTFGLIAGKNGETIVFAVTKMMREACLAYVAARKEAGLPASKFALCSEKGTKLHKRTVSLDMEAAFEAAGFDENQRIHALRYTAATRLLEAGFSYEDIQKLTGHRMAEMARHYTRKARQAPVVAATFDEMDALTASPPHTEEDVTAKPAKGYRISPRVVPVTNEDLEAAPRIGRRPTRATPTGRRSRSTTGRPEPGR